MSSHEEKDRALVRLGFVYISAGKAQMMLCQPVYDTIEGYRTCETPPREIWVAGFWLNKYCVTNAEFEEFALRHRRCPASIGDRQPVVEISYAAAIAYCEWRSKKEGLRLRLPTEPEWVLATGNHVFAYGSETTEIERANTQTRGHGVRLDATVEVDDPRFPPNEYGIYHLGGNVWNFTLGHYTANVGHGAWGAYSDGEYCIVKGGSFGNCPDSARTQTRGIMDIAIRSPIIGFRLAHGAIDY